MHPRQTAGFQEVRGESEWVSEWEEGGNEMGTGVERTKSLRTNWPSGSEEDGMHNEDGDEEDGMHNEDGDEEDEDDEDEDDDDDSDDEDGQLVPGFPPQVKRVVVPNTMEEDKGHIPVAIATPYEVVERRYACVIGIEKWERAAMLGAAMGAESMARVRLRMVEGLVGMVSESGNEEVEEEEEEEVEEDVWERGSGIDGDDGSDIAVASWKERMERQRGGRWLGGERTSCKWERGEGAGRGRCGR